MADKTIELAVIEGTPNDKSPEGYTPRMTVQVTYSRGGVSWFNGQEHPSGYSLVVSFDCLNPEGYRTFVLDAKAGNPAFFLKDSKRFSVTTLEGVATQVRENFAQLHEEVNELYLRAIEKRDEYDWPKDIDWGEEFAGFLTLGC